MDNARLTWLFNRYIDKLLSPEEEEELFELIALPENEQAVKELMEDVWAEFHPQQPPFEPETGAIMLEQVMSRGDAPTVRRRIHIWRWAAAAAILALVCIIGGRLLFSSRPGGSHNDPFAQRRTANIIPGHDQAVLTLADGTEVPLDSAGSQLIQQGPVAIRQQNGRLQYSLHSQAPAAGSNTLTVPRGGQYQIVLPDGSRVWLNSASRLKYPVAFTGNERVVELQGQGYFEIAPQAAMPFKVQVNGLEVQVLGTGFDIMAYPDERTVNTTLIEGAVKVTNGKTASILKPGQQAVLDQAARTIAVRQADVSSVTAWKSGLFVFNNADLSIILREIARWYDVEIVNESGHNAELYGGSISRRQDLREVLRLLESDGSNHFKIEGRRLIVQP
jgi:transmembrane sensor